MIIVQLMGGRGNQMFQWAFAKSLSLRFGLDLGIDLSYLKRRNFEQEQITRDYELDVFELVPKFDIDLTNLISLSEYKNYNYCQDIIDKVIQLSSHNILLKGFWQSPKYFLEFEDEIRKDFEFKDNILLTKDAELLSLVNDIKNSNSVLIHVRRTDYLKTNYHGVVDMNYINQGIEIISSKINNPRYFIFSDDIEWCVENIKINNSFFVTDNYKGVDYGNHLQLMKLCKHFIISNSTFSWWGAWLNESENKIVVSPKKWITDMSVNTSDVIPNNWIRI